MAKEIKRKKGWSRYSKPLLSNAPIKPQEFIYLNSRSIIAEKHIYTDIKYSKSDFTIPNDLSFDDISFEIIEDETSYGDRDMKIIFYSKKDSKQPNPYYEKQLEAYKKALAEWHKRKEEFKQELVQWKLWVKQEEEKDLQKKLKRAQELLEKHGKQVK